MHWESLWGDGFPGWHIECSAMAMNYLGDQFDIHTGGEDHLSVHHPNEIAQAEGATSKKPFVKYWVHHAFLRVDGKKMSKSLGNVFKVEDAEEKGYEPLSLRYLYLTAHYKDSQNFTWQALSSAQKALQRLRSQVLAAKEQKQRSSLSKEKQKKINTFRDSFIKAINDDFNTPKALAIAWNTLKSNIPSRDKYELVLMFDEIFGLKLSEVKKEKFKIPANIQKMARKRDQLRNDGKFKEADKIRKEMKKLGYIAFDTQDKSVFKPDKDE